MFNSKKEKTEKKEKLPSFRDRNQAFVCTMNGPYELNIENFGSLGDYSEKRIVLHPWKSTITIEGERLLIEYFSDIDMKITGRIRSLDFD